jgi:tetratricopeptide (TPR) repeat protein
MRWYRRIEKSNVYQLFDRSRMERQAAARDLFRRGFEAEQVTPRTHAVLVFALAFYQQAIHCDPCHADAWINAGTLFFSMGDFSRARRYYRMAVAADPLRATAWFNLACVLDEERRYSAAKEAYLKALSLYGDYADAHYNLAALCRMGDDPHGAIRHFKEFLRCADAGDTYRRSARRQIMCLSSWDLHVIRRPPATVLSEVSESVIMDEG